MLLRLHRPRRLLRRATSNILAETGTGMYRQPMLDQRDDYAVMV
jgi:hypothetical protein